VTDSMPTPIPDAMSAATVTLGCRQQARASRRIQPVGAEAGLGTTTRLCGTRGVAR
jgi:hypothetical protein